MRRHSPSLRSLLLVALTAASLVGVGSAPPARAATVSFVGAASAQVQGGSTSLTIPRPAGTAPGQVMVAAVGIVDDDPSFEAPPGWSLVREDLLHDSFRQAVYVKVAAASEPAGYTWTLPAWRRVAGGIVTYAGIDTGAPVAAHAGLVQADAASDVTAPSVTTSTGGSMLVHLAVTNSESTISPPAGMSERWEAASWRDDSSRDVSLAASDAVQTSAGATGPRSATATAPGPRAGALIALQPDGGSPPPPPPPPPDGAITVVGSSSDSSPDSRTGITVARPAGTSPGDVMVAAIAIVDDDPTYQAPGGWAQIRTGTVLNRLRLETFVKVAGSTEPAAYTWTLSDWRRIAGGITTYRGVHATSPVDTHGALAAGDDGTVVTAPSVSTSTPGSMLVHVAVVSAEAALTPPGGMTEAWEATGWRAGSPRDVTISSSHAVQPEAGPSGDRSATASAAGARIGTLMALRPGEGPPLPPPPPPPPPPPGDPVLVGAGDIAYCGNDNAEATARLLDGVVAAHPGATVFTAGDNAYLDGSPAEFRDCYDPTWGRHKARTRPAPGNHEYQTPDAAGYYAYFGAAAGDPATGYYSYDLGDWHIVVLNSECARVGGCHAGSPQETWLRADLAASPKECTAAYWHHPRFSSSGKRGPDPRTQGLWQALYDHGAELVIAGHDHLYERFDPMDAGGRLDPDFGLRSFVVGTGGRSHQGFSTVQPNSVARNGSTYGVIQFTLHDGSYEWEFLPVAGATFSDAGAGSCHGAPAPSTARTYTATGDALVADDRPNTNFGSDPMLLVDLAPIEMESLIRFDVTGLSGTVTNARLRLWVTNPTGNGPKLYPTDNGWTEGSVTWNSRPPPSGGVLADAGALSAGTFLDYDVTARVTGDGTWSFLLRPDSTDGADFHSRENANPPQLIVTTSG